MIVLKQRCEEITKKDGQNCSVEKMSERLQNVSGPLDIRSSSSERSSGYTCCKCESEAKVPFQSACDHVCCFKCWKEVFNNLDKKCPGCGVRVRGRDLKRLLFPGPGSEDPG